MKRTIWMTATALMLAILLLLAGCGGNDTSGESADGRSSGTAVEQGDVTDGVPIYPGATEADVSAMRRGGPVEDGRNPDSMPQVDDGWDSTGRPAPPGGQEPPEGMEAGSPPDGMRAMPVAYSTPDSVDKVVNWYREQLSGMTDFEEAEMPSRGGADEDGAGEGAAFAFKVGDTRKMVMIRTGTPEDGGTLIMISNAGQGRPQSPPASQE